MKGQANIDWLRTGHYCNQTDCRECNENKAADELEELRDAIRHVARPEISPYWVPRSFHDSMLKQARGYEEFHK